MADPAAVRGLDLDMTYDDGFAAYVNGLEVARRNLPGSAGGETPSTCPDACDTNDDELHDIADPIALLSYLFVAGPAPPPPHPEAGLDPAGEDLACR